MSSPLERVREALLADSAVAAALGSRIYPVEMPQNAALPAAVVGEVSSAPSPTLDAGPTALEAIRLQVDVYAKDYSVAYATGKLIAAAVLRLRSPTLNGTLEVGRDLYESDTKLHRRSLDFLLWAR